jgi:hypothetical protein
VNTYAQIQCRPTPILWETEIKRDNFAFEAGISGASFAGVSYPLQVTHGQPADVGSGFSSAEFAGVSYPFAGVVIITREEDEAGSEVVAFLGVSYPDIVMHGQDETEKGLTNAAFAGVSYPLVVHNGHEAAESGKANTTFAGVSYYA